MKEVGLKQMHKPNSKQAKVDVVKEKRKKIKEQKPMKHCDSEPYSNSKLRERWIQCTNCKIWAHAECTDGIQNFESCVSEL